MTFLKSRIFQHLSYALVGLISLSLAVFISTWIVKAGRTQEQQVIPPPPPIQGINQAPEASETSTGSPVTPAPGDVAAPGGVATTNLPPVVNVSEGAPFLEPYVFDTREGRRNPFRQPLAANASENAVEIPGTPLERFELDELKLVGILWDVRAPKAMIIDPQGEVHVIGKDDRIGRKRGYIAVIREGEVVVVETSSFNGQNTYATRVMRIAN